jgi:hypothetical protein
MKLGRTYDEKDFAVAITVVGLHHEERHRDIEHEKKYNEAQSKKEKARESTLPSLSLRIIKAIESSLMIKDKRRHGFPILLSPKTRTS